MKISTLESSFLKFNIHLSYDQANPFVSICPRYKHVCKKDVCADIHSSIMHNSGQLEIIQIAKNWLLSSHVVVPPYCGIQVSNAKKWIIPETTWLNHRICKWKKWKMNCMILFEKIWKFLERAKEMKYTLGIVWDLLVFCCKVIMKKLWGC